MSMLHTHRARQLPGPDRLVFRLFALCLLSLPVLYGCGSGEEGKPIPNAKPLDPALAQQYKGKLRTLGMNPGRNVPGPKAAP